VAELTLRLVVDPVTGKREVVVEYRSDPDALPEEHEEAHRRLAGAVGATHRVGSAGEHEPVHEHEREHEHEPEGESS
jgi:hypothetical protein